MLEPVEPSSPPILFFDGVCGLCNSFVDFALRHDRKGRVLFAPLQGSTAATQLDPANTATLDTVVLLENGRSYKRSSAIVRVLKQLGGIWTALAWLLWLIPWPLRDLGYRIIAKTRYRLFGRKESCRIPSVEERARFLD